jgi:formylglycine-generating enzyme required for sulfatase activity
MRKEGKNTKKAGLISLVALSAMSTTVAGVTVDVVKVGNASNAFDTAVMQDGTTNYGDVAYEFYIGKYEVNNAQYAEFLNAVAATDSYGLYYTNAAPGMEITRSGSPSNYTYTADAGHELEPVHRISTWDAMRFANWMHNGQPTGAQVSATTEDGAYFINGEVGSGGGGISRRYWAVWWLPSEDEWYKAAYHKNDGVTGNYWAWPASAAPKPAASTPPGAANSANFNGVVGHFTDVGAYSNSPSPYGTFDQGGNCWEVLETTAYGDRVNRGDGYAGSGNYMQSNKRNWGPPNAESQNQGFRLAYGPPPTPTNCTTMEVVRVGNSGNAFDTAVMQDGTTNYGDVAYEFLIGKYEVCNGQYAEFLNAVAATDTYGLYYTNAAPGMEITRSGASGSYTYTANAGHELEPVIRTSTWDAMRFANWMHNGKPTGAQDLSTTEDGAYFLNGETSAGGGGIVRESDAEWWLPSEDEWYKAAYHKNDGVTGNYWAWPASAAAKPLAFTPPGPTNSANFNNIVGHFTAIGAYFTSPSPYGTFDQGGNVWEVLETIRSGNDRVNRGHDYAGNGANMQSNQRNWGPPNLKFSTTGFRVAAKVPDEPPAGMVFTVR